jgi:hypothetical protein
MVLSRVAARLGDHHSDDFFQLLKRERIKRRIYATRDEARSDVFDYIEMFYNPIRRHGSNDGLSQVEFERQFIFSNRVSRKPGAIHTSMRCCRKLLHNGEQISPAVG